jgi:DNA-binding NarL/FixJ family response regulator
LPQLSPRLRQTLDRLLAGDSEKQIAKSLDLSQNTVHVYIKELYRRCEVGSRGELLSRFVEPPQ